jgi:hypothetical protein
MAMTRAQLAADLWGMLQRQFAEADIANEDSTGNLKEPVDSTLLALGVDYAELATAEVANSDVVKARILARYYGLSAVYDAVLNSVDVQVDAPNVNLRRSQRVANLKAAVDAARAVALPFISVENEGSWFVGSVDLGITQPSCREDYA